MALTVNMTEKKMRLMHSVTHETRVRKAERAIREQTIQQHLNTLHLLNQGAATYGITYYTEDVDTLEFLSGAEPVTGAAGDSNGS